MGEKNNIEKLSNTTDDNSYIDIPDTEIMQLHKEILESYNKNNLKNKGVKPLWDTKEKTTVESLDAKELQLIFLYKYKNKLVHKDLISAFVRKKKPNAGLDQQVRHLGSQYNWYVLNKNAKIPGSDETVPSGYHYLVNIEQASPKAINSIKKREKRLAAKDFEELKITYKNKCATCGIEEGTKDERYNDVKVQLQQGHMDPTKPLTLKNTIPQCQYCNQVYKNYFCFNENGRIVRITNAEFILKSNENIQKEMYLLLKNKFDT